MTLPVHCQMKNSKDYLKHYIKFVNSSVVVHYFTTAISTFSYRAEKAVKLDCHALVTWLEC